MIISTSVPFSMPAFLRSSFFFGGSGQPGVPGISVSGSENLAKAVFVPQPDESRSPLLADRGFLVSFHQKGLFSQMNKNDSLYFKPATNRFNRFSTRSTTPGSADLDSPEIVELSFKKCYK
ncbi:hypothetical protein [Dehalogenimonas sp. 4OHTPN]|uniref:Uncharacterized protein n=1 Tax=Dehalogenimonas sp. 4OHTPN TaxID=3166643 RepID=A0AAU8G7H6_9CHLR